MENLENNVKRNEFINRDNKSIYIAGSICALGTTVTAAVSRNVPLSLFIGAVGVYATPILASFIEYIRGDKYIR